MENWCLLLRVQFSLTAEDAPNRVAVVAIVVVVRVDVVCVYVQVVHVVVIVPSRGPPVAVGTLIVRRAIVEIAGQGQGIFFDQEDERSHGRPGVINMHGAQL